MKVKNKWKLLAGMAVIWLLSGNAAAYAAGNMAVVETCTGESEIMLYLKGAAGDISNIQVQAGTAVCSDLTFSRLTECGLPVKTLIMLDNSLSIPKAERKRILKIIQNIISDRMENEEMAIAVFNEGIAYLADYTSDDTALGEAVGKITFQGSNTYLTDVLYELLSAQGAADQDAVNQGAVNQKEAFYRMLVISDGMDNKSIGYTKDELYALLKESSMPIYTIGAQTKKKDNNEQLENMFAISRMTNAESFLLDRTKDLQEISQALDKDREIVRITVRPAEELLDGSKKTVKITMDTGESVSYEVTMPQQVRTLQPQKDETQAQNLSQNQKEAAETDADKLTAQTESEDQEKVKEQAGTKYLAMLFVPVCLLAAAAFFIVGKKKREEKNKPQGTPAKAFDRAVNLAEELPLDDDFTDEEQTNLMDATEVMDDDHTVSMYETDDIHSYDLILTDVRMPARTFQAPFQDSLVIGRKQGMCSIVIDQDMSVSGQHCKITKRDGGFYISDLQSSNGTFVDGCRIVSETEIMPGAVIKMGKSEFRFEVR